jgi:hypothetical protein
MPAADAGSGTELSAIELARLQDFHAWKLPIPQTQQPVKRVELVLVKPDGSIIRKSGTSYGGNPPPAWTNILLGFHYEGGGFVGTLECQGPKDTLTWSLNFTNGPAEHPRSWSGRARFHGNRADLATFWTSEEAARSGGNDYTTLAVELVK